MWDIIGHTDVIAQIDRALRTDRLPSAILLTGPSGVGKEALAHALAQALNCTGADPPCGECTSCRQTAGGNHPDVEILTPAEGKDSIAIAQTRVLRDAASLKPFQGRRKVFIIVGAEALTAQAADSLLKTLEEPPPRVTLILTAPGIDALPATVISRCRVFPLRPVSAETIEQALISRDTSPEMARRVARLARGRPGWALSAVRQPKLLAQQEEMVERLAGVFVLDAAERLQLIESLTGERRDRSAIRRHVEVLSLLARDLLLLAHGRAPLLATGTARSALQMQAERLNEGTIVQFLHRIGETMARIDANVDPRLSLEALLLALP